MTDPLWHRVLLVVPSLLLPLLILFVLVLFRRQIQSKFSDLTTVKLSVVEMTFAETLKDARPDVRVPIVDRLGVVARAKHAREQCAGEAHPVGG